MDLAKFDVRAAANKGAFLHLRDPFTEEPMYCSDKKTPFGLNVLGRDADALQQVVSDSRKELADGKIDHEELGIRTTVAAIVGWSDEMELDGKPFPYSPENARILIQDRRTDWIAEQLVPFYARRRNFVKNVGEN